jgi:kumamolisin
MPNIPAGYTKLTGSERKPRKGATRMGPADPHESVVVSLYLRTQPGAPPLPKLDSYTPQLGQRVILSRAELAQRHGASQEDIQAVSSFAKESGLAVVHTDAARRLVQVSGTVAQLSKAFSTELSTYKSADESYRGREGALQLPSSVAGVIEGIFGLDNRRMARRMGAAGVAPAPVPLTPPQVAKAYNFPTPTQGAAGQTIALLEFSGPIPGNSTCGFAQSDIDGYIQFLNGTGGGLKSTNVASVTVTGSNGNVPGGAGNIETTLDIEVVASVAQNARIVVYFAPMTEAGWVDAISTIVHDTTNNPSVLSISWGWPELEADAMQTEPWPFEWTQQAFNQMTQSFQAAAAIGMTVLAASGDHGTDCGQQDGSAHVMYPASDPGLISCGGTIIKSISPLVEDTWNDFNMADGGGGATGGGISYLAGLPSYQANAHVPVSVNPDHHQGRGLPDVAGNASPNSGYILWLNGQATSSAVGGTSAVAPLYAALIALINASLSTKLGYLNPTLYSLGTSSAFRDINDGVSNAVPPAPGYNSGPGWDACTGWGSIDGSAILGALQAQTAPDPCQTMLQRLDTELRNPFGVPESAVPGWEKQLSNCLQNGKITQAQYNAALSALKNPRPVS